MTGTFFSGRNRQNYDRKKKVPVVCRQTTVSFFSGRNNDRAPARQTTVSFFLVVIMISRTRQTKDWSFFFGCNNDRAPTRQTTVSSFLIKLSRHNKKTAYFPPEPKTDTTAVPPAHAKRVYSFLCQSVSLSVCLSVSKG